MDVVFKAKSFAKGAYAAQGRSSSTLLEHSEGVARLVWQATLDDTITAAALLHDVMINTKVSAETLVEEFGYDIASLVLEVTDVSSARDGSRAYRNALDRAHLANASPVGQTLKLADLIDHTATALTQDPGGRRATINELSTFLDVLPRADPTLLRKARDMLASCDEAMAA